MCFFKNIMAAGALAVAALAAAAGVGAEDIFFFFREGLGDGAWWGRRVGNRVGGGNV